MPPDSPSPTLPEFLEKARAVNPGVSDDALTGYWHENYAPPAAETPAMPSLPDFLAKAKAVNPGVPDADLTAYWHTEYGSKGAAEAPSSVLRRAADLPIGLAKGVVDLPKAGVGLLDIGTGGDVGRGATLALEALGKDADTLGLPRWARPSQWSSLLAEHYSPETQEAVRLASAETKRATDDATARGEDWLGQILAGAKGTATGFVEHPAAAIPLISENLPQMYAIAKGVSLALKPLQAALDAKIAAGTLTQDAANTILGKAASRASAVGEGLLSAGQVSSQISADQPDAGFVEHLAAGAAGILTGGIAHLTGKIPGLENPEAVLAKRLLGKPAGFAGSLPERIGKGVLAEGVIQEPLQSGQEQIWQNIAEGKPWHEGVGEQAIQGLVAGSAIGGSAGALGGPATISTPLPSGGPPTPDPIATILGATTTDEVITNAHTSVGTSLVTSEDFDTFIQSQKQVGEDVVVAATANLETAELEAQHAEDQKALESIFSFAGETNEVTFDERGNSFYQGAPLNVVTKASLPDVTPPDGGLSKEKFDALQDFAHDLFGKHIVFYEDRDTLPEGVVFKKAHPTRIFMSNRQLSADFFTVFGHEFFHHLKGTPFYTALQEAIWEVRTPAWKELAIARHGDLSHEALLDEVTSDIGGTELEKNEVWEKVFVNLRERNGEAQAKAELNGFIDHIKEMIGKIKRLIASRPWATGFGKNKKTLAEQYVTDLTKLHDALAAGVADAIYKRKGSKPDTGKLELSKKPSEAPREILHPETVLKFKELASAQRGAPESAMLNVQEVLGGGVMNPVVEHVGDLIHRMTERSAQGESQKDTILSKIDRSLRALERPHGFEKEHHENLRNNARVRNRPVAELRAAVDAALLAYAKEHKKLPVYNKAHWLAREAAVAVGEQRFPDAVRHLKELKKLASSKDFSKAAFEYTKDETGKLSTYEPSTSEAKASTSAEKQPVISASSEPNTPAAEPNMLPTVGHPLKFSKKTAMSEEDKELAKLYDNAPLFDKKAKAAWNELKKETARLYQNVIKLVKVERVTGQPYPDHTAMNADIAKGSFKVTTDHSEHPLWTVEDNVKFRVVHDYIGHFETGFDFGLEGERMAFEYHASRLTNALAIRALKVEVYGQAAAAIAHNGDFQPQKIFLLPAQEAYDYASTQIDLAPAIAKKVFAISEPIKVEDLADDGRETNPHITVKYGLHSEDPKQAAVVLTGEAPVKATIGEIGMFEREEYDVLVLMVDSPQLVAMNTKISDALENTTDFAYSPHITLAFVKPGLGAGYVQSLRNTLKNTIVTADTISFSNKQGEKTAIPLGQKKVTSKTATLEHYSRTEGLHAISPAFHGRGQIGAERRRMENEGTGYLPRSYFYRAGSTPEARFKGLRKYTVTVPEDRLVDLATLSGSPTDREQSAKKAGYLGFYNSESSMPEAVALLKTVPVARPAAQKVATPRSEQTEQPRFSPKIWFSQLGNTLIDKMPVRASKAQVRGIIQSPGVKAEEVKWTGILDHLETLSEPVMKDELLQWLSDNNVVVNEVVKRKPISSLAPGYQGADDLPEPMSIAEFNSGWIQGHRAHYHQDFPEVSIRESTPEEETTQYRFTLRIPEMQFVERYVTFAGASEAAYERIVAAPNRANEAALDAEDEEGSSTQYEGYTLPGGTDYTELLLTWPVVNKLGHGPETNNPTLGGQAFISPHFDEPNIIAHVRFDTRKDADGKIVLFLQEVQSDRYELGLERGYVGQKPEDEARLARVIEDLRTAVELKVRENLTKEQTRLAARIKLNAYDIPPGPFSTSWSELVLKRMLRWAAEHNYDRLAWTTGAQQNERYGLAKHVESIAIDRSLYGNGKARYSVTATGKNGRVSFEDRHITPERVIEILGKELGTKAIEKADAANGKMADLSGLDLEVGGSGMKYFYDQMLPKFMEKYLKRWGTTVEPMPLARQGFEKPNEATGQTVHSISLTPEMKDSVINKGQPMFARRTVPSTYPLTQPGRLDKVVRILVDKHIDMRRLVEDIRAAGNTIPEEMNPMLAEQMYQKRDQQQAKDFTNDELAPFINTMRLAKVSVEQVNEYAHAKFIIDDGMNARYQALRPDLAQDPSFDKLAGMTDAQAQNILANAPAIMPRLMADLKQMVETTRSLMVSYGLEKQSTVDGWRKAFSFYVPLRREGFDDSGHPTGAGRSVRGSTVKQRLGSDLPVENILANIAQARDQIVTRGEKQRPVIAFAALMMRYPNAAIATLDKYAQIEYTDPVTGLKQYVPSGIGQYKVPTVLRLDSKTGTMKPFPDPTYKGRDNVVNFRLNGEDYGIVFNERYARAVEIAKAFKDLDTVRLNVVVQAIAPYTRYLAAVNTQYNPIFGVVNFVRDTQFAMLTLSATPLSGQRAAVLKNTASVMGAIYADARAVRQGTNLASPNARLWQRFEHVGGPVGYRDLFYTTAERAHDIERMLDPSWSRVRSLRDLGTRIEDTPFFRLLSDYNLMMENAIRLGIFKTAVELRSPVRTEDFQEQTPEGDWRISDLRAASFAKNATVNFNQKGQLGAFAGSLYAFFNANAQGTAQIGQTMFERVPQPLLPGTQERPPATFRLSALGKKIVVGGLMVGVLQTFLLAMAGFDDDDPPEFVKQKNFVYPVPRVIDPKGYGMIPMPLGFNLLPNAGRLMAETVKNGLEGKPLKVMKKSFDLLGALFGTLSPTGGSPDVLQEIAPTVMDPLVALKTNRDWTGKSIAKEDRSSLDPTPGHSRAHDTATPWAKGLARFINWATGGDEYEPGLRSPTPDEIDYLISQLTGGVGREVSKAAQVIRSTGIPGVLEGTGEELPPHKIPLFGRFYGTADSASAIRSRFYEHVKEANIAYNAFEGRALHHEPFSEYIKTHPEARFAKVAIQVQDDLGILQKQKRLMLDKGASKDAIRLQEAKITGLMERFVNLVEKAQNQEPAGSP